MATRYDKRGYVYLGAATAAGLTIWLRTRSAGQLPAGHDAWRRAGHVRSRGAPGRCPRLACGNCR
ncbi:hypothetical protein DEJ46_00725 [Streptomyces venezuelae]|uniref:Uncharacterized protein n=1 Tax=Streptomyces venezuelae TaxID=54571 RepID=A0A5P2AJU8_STRVZ|nr:hypothetical protein DEJ46_00725 [Streptomyces venezuelae]